jgi:hypothetical protein
MLYLLYDVACLSVSPNNSTIGTLRTNAMSSIVFNLTVFDSNILKNDEPLFMPSLK